MAKKILIQDGSFLWKPFINDKNTLDAEGPYCLSCKTELVEDWQGDPDSEIKTIFLTCAGCHKDIKVGEAHFLDKETMVGAEKRAFLLRMAAKDLEEYEIVSIDSIPGIQLTDHEEKKLN